MRWFWWFVSLVPIAIMPVIWITARLCRTNKRSSTSITTNCRLRGVFDTRSSVTDRMRLVDDNSVDQSDYVYASRANCMSSNYGFQRHFLSCVRSWLSDCQKDYLLDAFKENANSSQKRQCVHSKQWLNKNINEMMWSGLSGCVASICLSVDQWFERRLWVSLLNLDWQILRRWLDGYTQF